jgi:hypothetical protein
MSCLRIVARYILAGYTPSSCNLRYRHAEPIPVVLPKK